MAVPQARKEQLVTQALKAAPRLAQRVQPDLLETPAPKA